MTRIYTRTGDAGTTGLVGGQRVKKNSLRIETYGTVDELSSAIGLARTALHDVASHGANDASKASATRLDAWLAWTQDVLFNLGSDLATPAGAGRDGAPVIVAADATALERAIDACQADLEPLNAFIHPGGAYAGAFLHVARTIARRAERLLVTLADVEPVAPETLTYLNRLSDALFVWSRWINHALGQPEHRWRADAKAPD
jgi:cob(I)alamin adenosyltransferase